MLVVPGPMGAVVAIRVCMRSHLPEVMGHVRGMDIDLVIFNLRRLWCRFMCKTGFVQDRTARLGSGPIVFDALFALTLFFKPL